MESYKILENGKAIECLICGYLSHDLNDIRFKYCFACHKLHATLKKGLDKRKDKFLERLVSSSKLAKKLNQKETVVTFKSDDS